MNLRGILLFASVAVLTEALFESEVCYGKYGCFTKDKSFSRLLVPLPQSPEKIGTTFRLYTPGQHNEHIIDDSDEEKLSSSDFQGRRRTIVLIHGYLENGFIPWMNRMRTALLERENINLITTDWKAGALHLYEQATANTKVVGAQVAELMKFIIKNSRTKPEHFYLVGFSLGAHTAGYAGARMCKEGNSIGRITGIDSAGRYFTDEDVDLRLSPSDAKFVDTIHTDGDFLGTPQDHGHIDFHVNGGKSQPPGCSEVPVVGAYAAWITCDHLRAPDYFTESVRSRCPWYSYRCDSRGDFDHGRCLSCDGECAQMGYLAEKTQGQVYGRHFVDTNKSPPFCAYHYLVTFWTADKFLAGLIDQVVVRLVGENGDTGDVDLQHRIIKDGSHESFVALSRKDLGELSSISVRFKGLLDKWYLVSARVTPGWEKKPYTACFNAWLSFSGEARDLQSGNQSC